MVRIVPHAQKSLDEQTRGKGWSVRRGIHDDGTPDDGSDDDNTKKTSPKKLPKVLTCCLKYMRRADKELPETLEEAGRRVNCRSHRAVRRDRPSQTGRDNGERESCPED